MIKRSGEGRGAPLTGGQQRAERPWRGRGGLIEPDSCADAEVHDSEMLPPSGVPPAGVTLGAARGVDREPQVKMARAHRAITLRGLS